MPDNFHNELFLFENYNKKVFVPSLREIKLNNPSRSAKLRFAVRSKNDFKYPDSLLQKFKKYLNLEAVNVQN